MRARAGRDQGNEDGGMGAYRFWLGLVRLLVCPGALWRARKGGVVLVKSRAQRLLRVATANAGGTMQAATATQRSADQTLQGGSAGYGGPKWLTTMTHYPGQDSGSPSAWA